MRDDSRCCGTGTCLINADGVCWCGQRWDGEKMSMPAPDHALDHPADHAPVPSPAPAVPPAHSGR